MSEVFHQHIGRLPAELVFDSRLTTYAVLDRLEQLDIRFPTLHLSSRWMVRELLAAADCQFMRLTKMSRKCLHSRTVDRRFQLRHG